VQRDNDQRLSLRGYLHHESTYIVLRERGEPMATADIVAEMQRRGPQHVSLHWRGWLKPESWKALQWPLPDDALRIVMRGAEKEDRVLA
jgi:hypothetical protein